MRKIRINEECIHMYILHTCQKLYKVPSSVKGPQKTPPPSEKLGKWTGWPFSYLWQHVEQQISVTVSCDVVDIFTSTWSRGCVTIPRKGAKGSSRNVIAKSVNSFHFTNASQKSQLILHISTDMDFLWPQNFALLFLVPYICKDTFS